MTTSRKSVAGRAEARDLDALSKELPEISRVLPMALLRAREATMCYIRPVLRQAGFTEQQWRVMRALFGSDPLDATTISLLASLRPPSLSRILNDLEKGGWIERTNGPHGGRRKLVALSPKGSKLIVGLAPMILRQHARMRERLGEKDYDLLLDLLNRCESVLLPHESGTRHGDDQ